MMSPGNKRGNNDHYPKGNGTNRKKLYATIQTDLLSTGYAMQNFCDEQDH